MDAVPTRLRSGITGLGLTDAYLVTLTVTDAAAGDVSVAMSLARPASNVPIATAISASSDPTVVSVSPILNRVPPKKIVENVQAIAPRHWW